MMNDEQLVQILRQNLEGFEQEDSSNAKLVKEALHDWELNKEEDLLNWWRQQESSRVYPFSSYLFWLWRADKIEGGVFQDFYYSINQLTSKSWSMPIVVTNGFDDPLFEGGFFDEEFSALQFRFSPSYRSLVVKEQEYPEFEGERIHLDILLDFLSFLLEKSGTGHLGFRQIASRKTISTERTITGTMLGPQIQRMPDFDFEQIEGALMRISNEKENGANGLTLLQLLHIRHRAILDSNAESKLITLWASIEAHWGTEDDEDKLITTAEKKQIKKCISLLSEDKSSKVVDQISKLKSKTKNEKIVEGISALDCAQEKEVKKIISSVFKLRSKIAHGTAMTSDEKVKTQEYISFLFSVIEELITKKFADCDVRFS